MSISRANPTVSNTTYTAPNAPSVVFPFKAARITIENLDATVPLEVSFDGVTTDAVLTPTKPSALLYFHQFTDRVWLRVGSGSVSAQLIAEGG